MTKSKSKYTISIAAIAIVFVSLGLVAKFAITCDHTSLINWLLDTLFRWFVSLSIS